MSNPILDPRGRGAKTAEPISDARPHLPSLRGARIGLLDNTKHNAGLFLERLGAMLKSEYGSEVSIVEVKKNFAVPVEEALIERFKEQCDAVIAGVGDCGSCSAAAVTDGITFQRAGLPAAVVITDAFGMTGKTMAKVQGDPDFEWITTEHPVAVLAPDEVEERARQALAGVVSALTEGAAA